ncbi:MAG: endonuclease/exonuclease/phosphatase family protein [Cohaesibacteraceae bacterium]
MADTTSSPPTSLRAPSRWPGRWNWRVELTGVIMVGFVALVLAAGLPRLLPDTPFVHLDQGRLHVGVGFIGAALAFWVLGAKLRAAISALAGLALLGSIALFFANAHAPPAPEAAPDISLISFNVLGFNPRGAEIAAYLANEAPDVAFVLEAPALHQHMDTMNAAFAHRAGCWPGPSCDMAIFSQHPLVDVEIVPFFTVHGRLLIATLDLPAGPVTLVAAHLTKPYYGNWHDLQLGRLNERLAQIEGTVVLAGDFNSQAFVPAFREALIERADLRLASRMQPTWPALSSSRLSYAGFAIDHVLVGGGLEPVSVSVIEDPLGSNHRGLMSRFALPAR